MSYRGRRGFLKQHLRINLGIEFKDQESREIFNKFADKHLGGDGILFLRLIAKNTNPAIAGRKRWDKGMSRFFVSGELLGIMWKRFVESETKMEVISPKGSGSLSVIKED